MFATEIRRKRVEKLRAARQWRWHLDEVYVKINGVTHYLCGPSIIQCLQSCFTGNQQKFCESAISFGLFERMGQNRFHRRRQYPSSEW